MKPAPLFIRTHARDNVVTACRGLAAATVLAEEGITCRQPIPEGHKVAVSEIRKDQPIIKFSQAIGFAMSDIGAGDHVHTHNIYLRAPQRKFEPAPGGAGAAIAPPPQRARFAGYLREDKRIGTRNYIGILTSVNCSATVAQQIAQYFNAERLRDYPAVDGVVALTHASGCGMPARHSAGLDNLQYTTAGYARHPNFAGVLIVGLGCEVNQIAPFLQRFQLAESESLQTLTIQASGGTTRAIRQGIEKIQPMLERAARARRQSLSVEHLRVGLQCGGSDAWSGIVANPSLGAAVDLLVRQGGGAILSETPEIYGAENLLLRRAAGPGVAASLIERLEWWRGYADTHGVELNNNPSPGNIEGGLSTILEKSLGAVAKSGTTPLRGVYQYARPIDTPGLVFMDAPGYDPCSVTGEIASGANLICFTTGRGSVFGAKPVPSIKLASNTRLYNAMREDMDINCGKVLDGEATIDSMAEEILQYMLAIASGEQSASEKLGFGDNEFVPWQIGAAM